MDRYREHTIAKKLRKSMLFSGGKSRLLILLSPVLFTGKALFWGTSAAQFISWWKWAFDTILSGHLPLWNPLVGMGAPLIANYQSALFYPPNWLRTRRSFLIHTEHPYRKVLLQTQKHEQKSMMNTNYQLNLVGLKLLKHLMQHRFGLNLLLQIWKSH